MFQLLSCENLPQVCLCGQQNNFFFVFVFFFYHNHINNFKSILYQCSFMLRSAMQGEEIM